MMPGGESARQNSNDNNIRFDDVEGNDDSPILPRRRETFVVGEGDESILPVVMTNDPMNNSNKNLQLNNSHLTESIESSSSSSNKNANNNLNDTKKKGDSTSSNKNNDKKSWMGGNNLTKKEMVIVLAITLIAIITIVGGFSVVFFVYRMTHKTNTNNKDTIDDEDSAIYDPTDRKIFLDNDELYRQILFHVVSSDNGILHDTLHSLPSTSSEIAMEDYWNTTENTYKRAASWLLYHDTRTKYKDEVPQRYLALVMYLGFQGSQWYNNTNWLTPEHICDWSGIVCAETMLRVPVITYQADTYQNISYNNVTEDFVGNGPLVRRITELDMENNRLNGTLSVVPWELLMDTVSSLRFSNNALHGTIPGESFGLLPKLTNLYLQNNDFTGTIPDTLINVEASSLGKYFYSHKEKSTFFGSCEYDFLMLLSVLPSPPPFLE